MFSTKSLLVPALLAATSTIGTSPAQDFDGQVQVDPRADTVTYDFRFSGPPRGQAALFVSVGLAPSPFNLPGIGQLYLDPLSLFPLSGLLPLDPAGQGGFQLVLPANLTTNTPLCFQALFVDTANNLRLTQDWLTLVQGMMPPAFVRPGYAFHHKSNAPVVSVEFLGAPGGQGTIEIRDTGGNLAGSGGAPIGANGRSAITPVPLNQPIQDGFTYRVRYQPPAGAAQTIGQGQF